MLKIRRPLGRLIFNMGIAIPGKTVFLIETAPRPFVSSITTAARYCLCNPLSKSVPGKFRLEGIVNAPVYKTEPFFTGIRHCKLSWFFHIASPLWANTTSHRRISFQKTNNTLFLVSSYLLVKQAVEQTTELQIRLHGVTVFYYTSMGWWAYIDNLLVFILITNMYF